MHGATIHFPSPPSWRGAQLKHKDNLLLRLLLLFVALMNSPIKSLTHPISANVATRNHIKGRYLAQCFQNNVMLFYTTVLTFTHNLKRSLRWLGNISNYKEIRSVESPQVIFMIFG
jgi:hypothetical protein